MSEVMANLWAKAQILAWPRNTCSRDNVPGLDLVFPVFGQLSFLLLPAKSTCFSMNPEINFRLFSEGPQSHAAVSNLRLEKIWEPGWCCLQKCDEVPKIPHTAG